MENLGSGSRQDERVGKIAAYIWAMCEGIAPEKYLALVGREQSLYDYHAEQILALAASAVSEAQTEHLWYDYLRRSDDLGAKKAFVEVVLKVASPLSTSLPPALDMEDLRLQDTYWTARKHWPKEAAAWWRLRSLLTRNNGSLVLDGYALRHAKAPCPIVFADPEDAWKYLHDQHSRGNLVGKKEEWEVYPLYRTVDAQYSKAARRDAPPTSSAEGSQS